MEPGHSEFRRSCAGSDSLSALRSNSDLRARFGWPERGRVGRALPQLRPAAGVSADQLGWSGPDEGVRDSHVEREHDQGGPVLSQPTKRARQRMSGLYCAHPEEVLTHVISVTLELSAALMGTERNRRALMSICSDVKLEKRAAQLALHHMLRAMVANDEPTREDFDQLVQEVAALAKES